MAEQYSFAGGRSATGQPVLRSATVKAPDQPGASPAAAGAPASPAPAMLGSGTPDVMPAAMPATQAGAAQQMPAATRTQDVSPVANSVGVATSNVGADPNGNLVPVTGPMPVLQQGAPANGQASGGNLSPIDPANSLRGQQIGFDGPSAPVQFGGTTVDPGQRLNFDINPGSVQDAANRSFQSQLPLLDSDFALQARDLSRQTSALGRAGSGLFNRGTNELSDRGRATRESLLGQLSYGAATTDAGNRLQADIARGGLQNAQEGRFMQASTANAGNALQSGMFNAGRADQLGLERLGLQERQQNRQDNLAQQANNNLLAQLGLFGQGFQGDPSQADLGASAALSQSAGQYGGNAEAQNKASGDLLNSVASGPLGQYALNLLRGGQSDPTRPAPVGDGSDGG